MNLITVTTCGTSTITHGQRENMSFIYKHANLQKSQYTPEDLQALDTIIMHQEEAIEHADNNAAKSLSAELHGLIDYYESKGRALNTPGDIHWLIHTDTYQGGEAARLIQEWGMHNGVNFIIQKIDSLNTANVDDFHAGINNLVKWCCDSLGERDSNHRVIFNLVGGFKSLQGYMQTLGMFYADETIYIFEAGGLLTIPRMPVDFDAQAKESVRKNLTAFRKMGELELVLDSKECAGIPDTLLMSDGKSCCLSEWGKIIWDKMKDEIYREELLPPLNANIRYADKMTRLAGELDGLHTGWLNSRIDMLSAFLSGGKMDGLKSVDYKKLKTQQGVSTHEFDLWNEGHMRGFCHEEGSSVVIDSIGRGLE
ncbi:MAG: CRISPR-associated protein [Synergistaceae bacterium]|nr:CRISPR-associated protein [Synergistaceae bacterium]